MRYVYAITDSWINRHTGKEQTDPNAWPIVENAVPTNAVWEPDQENDTRETWRDADRNYRYFRQPLAESN